jgi:hypothetical protein
VPEN